MQSLSWENIFTEDTSIWVHFFFVVDFFFLCEPPFTKHVSLTTDTFPLPIAEALQIFDTHQHRLPFYCLKDDLPSSSRANVSLSLSLSLFLD